MAEIVDFGLQQHKIKMDNSYFDNGLSVVAGDTGRRIEVQLLDTNGMVQDTTGLKLRLNAVVEGKATYTDATLVDAATGKYQLDLSNGMFLAPGKWQFQWQIIDAAGKKLHSFAFTGNVGSNISEGGSQATNFYLNLEDLKAMQEEFSNGTIQTFPLDGSVSTTKLKKDVYDLIDKGVIEGDWFLNFPITGWSSANPSTNFIINKPVVSDGIVRKLKINSVTDGNVLFYILEKIGETFKLISKLTIPTIQGTNIYEVLVPVKTGQYIGVKGAIRYSSTGGYGFYDNKTANLEIGQTYTAVLSALSTAALTFDISYAYETTLYKTLVNGGKTNRPTDGQVNFKVPANQKLVDSTSTATTIIDNETTIVQVPSVLWLPTNYTTTGKKTPLVMMAHGHGEYVDSNGNWGSNQTWIAWKNQLVNAGYAVFDVNGYDNTIAMGSKSWGSPRAIEAYYKAYLFILQNYNVDEKIIVTGGSMGGMAALNFANAHSDVIRCVLAYAPCLDFLNQGGGNSLWVTEYKASYGTDTAKNVDGWSPINIKHLSVPLKIWHGTGDTTIAHSYSQTLIDNLKANNSPCELRLLNGASHDVAYGNATVMAESLIFMNRFVLN